MPGGLSDLGGPKHLSIPLVMKGNDLLYSGGQKNYHHDTTTNDQGYRHPGQSVCSWDALQENALVVLQKPPPGTEYNHHNTTGVYCK